MIYTSDESLYRFDCLIELDFRLTLGKMDKSSVQVIILKFFDRFYKISFWIVIIGVGLKISKNLLQKTFKIDITQCEGRSCSSTKPQIRSLVSFLPLLQTGFRETGSGGAVLL